MQGGDSFKGLSGRILKANLFTVALFGALWLAIILYFSAERERDGDIRTSANRLSIEILELRRAEKDFQTRDLHNPAFLEAALGSGAVSVPGTNLEKWERRSANLMNEIATMHRLAEGSDGFDANVLNDLDEKAGVYISRFRDLARAYHRMGFKDWGLEGEWRKIVHELETPIQASGDAPLTIALLSLRRDEKDYLLRGEAKNVEEVKKSLADLRTRLKATPSHAAFADKTDRYGAAFDAYLDQRRKIGLSAEEGLQGEMRRAIHDLDKDTLAIRDKAVQLDERAAARFPWILGLGALVGLVAAGAVGAGLGRRVARPISELAATCQSAAAELQAAANQQATGTKEQATSMQEISTTINELLASSRQIADSARRVAQIAENAGAAARSGDDTVRRSQESIEGIRRQVDLIVTHMLDLGKKSQEIGGVLEIINELAEQTNILAINATIEAAGGGESGKRFGVVADEIRKLADRVGGSTKEIQTLVEQVRGAVNATVMATESGSKAVDAGARQFGEVAASFKQIAGLVGTNSEAGREIELTTKQQATAVEQVNSGVLGVGQATREMEASTTQTFQTATQLASVSRELAKLVNASGNGTA
ncbi:MAG TPA: methyl-accepting chemotaxis protein [Planctomycetota bacterium]